MTGGGIFVNGSGVEEVAVAAAVSECGPAPYRMWWPVLVLLVVPGGGLYANCAVWLGIWYNRRRLLQRSPVYFYLLSLAASDILNCTLLLPMAAVKAFLGKFPGSFYLCRAWLAADLLLTSATALHLCLLSLQLCVGLAGVRMCRSRCHVASMLSAIWILAFAATVSEMMVWGQHVLAADSSRHCLSCVPFSPAFVIASGILSFWSPLLMLFVAYPCCLYFLWRMRCRMNDRESRCRSRIPCQESHKVRAQASPRYSPKPVAHLNSSLEQQKEPLVRKLSRRLSSRRRKEENQMTGPASPKLDRHPSLRYSIKRSASSNNGSHKRRSDRQRRRKEAGAMTETGTPLLMMASDMRVSTDSMSHSAATDVDRSTSELDDQTICQILLADAATTSSFKHSSLKHGRGSSAKNRKKGSLSATPASPTLDRHPSLRYSTKRRGERNRQGSGSRSPSIISHHSCLSRTPSQRSNALSRTPSQRSTRRSPNTILTPTPAMHSVCKLQPDVSEAPSHRSHHNNVFVFPDAVTKTEKSQRGTPHESGTKSHSQPDLDGAGDGRGQEPTPRGGSRSPAMPGRSPGVENAECATSAEGRRNSKHQSGDGIDQLGPSSQQANHSSCHEEPVDEAHSGEHSPMLLTVDHLSPSLAASKKNLNSPNTSHTMDSLLLPHEHDSMMALPRAQSIESLSDQETERSRRRKSLRRRGGLEFVTSFKLTFMLGLMVVSFVALHLPYFVTTLVWAVGYPPPRGTHSVAVFITEWLAYATSLSNPLLVLAFHKDLISAVNCATSS